MNPLAALFGPKVLPICGPSYQLAVRKADVQRAVNLCLVGMEVQGKAPFILDSVPGLILFANLGAELRGGIEIGTRAFCVAGNTLYEIFGAGTFAARGVLGTTTGPVSMTFGLTQLVIVDGFGYVFTLATNAFQNITDPDFAGANTVDFDDNYFIFSRDRHGQQFQITAVNDATTVDGLDFASAESAPDDLVGHRVIQGGCLLMGTLSGELFVDTGAADFPFERSQGSGFRVGLMARASLQRIDNGAMWVGRDETGSGIVYRLNGGQPQRVSTQAIEQAIQASSDLSQAAAYVYQDKGLTFYCLNAPGLTSTWCFEVASSQWHERCDLDGFGQYKAGRVVCHFFAFGKHLGGGSDGKVYELSKTTYTNAGDTLARERVTPHMAVPNRLRQFFSSFWLDCTTGEAPQGVQAYVELSWSKDSGATYSNPMLRSIGLVGERFSRLLWCALGSAKDRIWRIKFTGNAPFAIVDGGSDVTSGKT